MTMKTVVIAAALASALAGCVTDQPTYLADGSKGHHVTCGGTMFSMGDCHKRAADLCGAQGFQIVAGGQESTPYAVVGASVNAAGGQAYGSSGHFVNRDLIVKCGKAPAR